MNRKFFYSSFTIALLIHVMSSPAQGTAFTYQGRLESNNATLNGSFDLKFTLFATNTAGTALEGPLTNETVAVSNGLFTSIIDFGASAFTGDSNWLEIAVRSHGNGAFAT